MEKATLLKIIAEKNDRFSIVFLTAMEKQTHTKKHVGSSIMMIVCIVGQNFDCNFICTLIETMKLLISK